METRLDHLYRSTKDLVNLLRESNATPGPDHVSEEDYDRLEIMQIKWALRGVK